VTERGQKDEDTNQQASHLDSAPSLAPASQPEQFLIHGQR